MPTWPWSRTRERFSSYSAADPAFAAWLRGEDELGISGEAVTPYTVLGLSAVIRSVSVISTTIAGLPLRTFEKLDDGSRKQVVSVFDDPDPDPDGQTPFAWVETIIIHLLLWRKAFLWKERQGLEVVGYRTIHPDSVQLETKGRRKIFRYRDENGVQQEVGSERFVHIPGPSLDGVDGHPFLEPAKRIFSAALSGDKAAAQTLRRGIRIAGLVTPADEKEDIPKAESTAILEQLRAKIVGTENAGDIAFINRRLKLDPWTPTNVDSQWQEARAFAIAEAGRLFGMPPHLLNDIEKQTSWGTGVAEQNLGLARFTLRGWSDRIEQVLTRQLPRREFTEFDYAGLLQGTPQQEIELLIEQVDAGILTINEARRIRNLPPLPDGDVPRPRDTPRPPRRPAQIPAEVA